MKIGLDLDGVVVDSIGWWIEVLNRKGGSKYTLATLPDTSSDPELIAYIQRNELETMIAPGPMPKCVEVVKQLRTQGHVLIVVTTRPPRLQQLTEAWLGYHGIVVDRLYFDADKPAVAEHEGLDLTVEDNPNLALALAMVGIPVLLFSAPYNREVEHELIDRCDGWLDVLKRIENRTVA